MLQSLANAADALPKCGTETKQGLLTRYYTITLQEVSVASQTWVGNSNAVDAADSEEIELRYGRITLLDNETGTRSCYDTRTSQTC